MPLIAADATSNGAQLYWHLGDLRAMYDFDEDIANRPGVKRPTISDYERTAWQDFIENQITPWGNTPFFVGIGNHELYAGKTRADFLVQFADWVNSPVLQQQRLRDDPKDYAPKTYYHWIEDGVDFIYLDNASPDQFDHWQMTWLQQVLKRAASNPDVHSLVVGMHAVLPDSLAPGHSMNDWPQQLQSGREVYSELLQWKAQTRKPVYLLASHSHFYIANVFNSETLRAKDAVLPGWIVGTAGAHRYLLPPTAKQADSAMTGVYGYLMGTVQPTGEIKFEFHEVKQSELPVSVLSKYGKDLVDFCFQHNKDE